MLKLVSAHDMPYKNVLEYYSSFPEDRRNKKNLGANIIAQMIDSPFSYQCLLEGKAYAQDIEMLFLIDDENPDYIIGFGSIKTINDYDEFDDEPTEGNIRFGIRESERNKGYGNMIFALILERCKEAGMGVVFVSCFKNNAPAERIFAKYGGQFDSYCPSENGHTAELPKYLFKLKPKEKNQAPSLALETKKDTN